MIDHAAVFRHCDSHFFGRLIGGQSVDLHLATSPRPSSAPTHDSTNDANVRGRLEALARDAHGRPNRVSRAADAVWKAFERKDWKLLAPYVGDKTRIKTIGMASDDPTEEASSVALSPAKMRAWFERQTGLDLHRDEAWFCSDRCCEYWSWNGSRNDVTDYLQKICFDTRGGGPILTRLEWEGG